MSVGVESGAVTRVSAVPASVNLSRLRVAAKRGLPPGSSFQFRRLRGLLEIRARPLRTPLGPSRHPRGIVRQRRAIRPPAHRRRPRATSQPLTPCSMASGMPPWWLPRPAGPVPSLPAANWARLPGCRPCPVRSGAGKNAPAYSSPRKSSWLRKPGELAPARRSPVPGSVRATVPAADRLPRSSAALRDTFRAKPRKGPQAGRQALLLDQPARLEQMPRAVRRRELTRPERETPPAESPCGAAGFSPAGSRDRRSASISEVERASTRSTRAEHRQRRPAISGLVEIDQHVRAVEGHTAGTPCHVAQQRHQLHRDVARNKMCSTDGRDRVNGRAQPARFAPAQSAAGAARSCRCQKRRSQRQRPRGRPSRLERKTAASPPVFA